jgi:hypothetical protein
MKFWMPLLILPFMNIAYVRSPRVEGNEKIMNELIALETQSWEAWKNRDGAFYESFLSNDHIEVGFYGISDRKEVVATVNSKSCVVKNYTVSQFKMTLIDSNTAILVYLATQETICSGKPLPTPIWISSLYQKRNNKWLNVAYQQTQALN